MAALKVVTRLIAVTVALGMPAPLGSLTVPMKVPPLVDWAGRRVAQSSTSKSKWELIIINGNTKWGSLRMKQFRF